MDLKVHYGFALAVYGAYVKDIGQSLRRNVGYQDVCTTLAIPASVLTSLQLRLPQRVT